MRYSKDIYTDFAMRSIEDKEPLENYVLKKTEENYIEFTNYQDILNFFSTSIAMLHQNESYDNIMNMRYFSERQYERINSILRRTWNYEKLGKLTKEEQEELKILAQKMKETIKKAEKLPQNIKTWRGTSLQSFERFGIKELKDLQELERQYFFDPAFISSSLIRENSFFNKSSSIHEAYNIEISYLIPEESKEGIFLSNSAYEKETEYLIAKESLFKILKVSINNEEKVAQLKMLLIPEHIWNKEYQQKIDTPHR